jgi:hypothetical protein
MLPSSAMSGFALRMNTFYFGCRAVGADLRDGLTFVPQPIGAGFCRQEVQVHVDTGGGYRLVGTPVARCGPLTS